MASLIQLSQVRHLLDCLSLCSKGAGSDSLVKTVIATIRSIIAHTASKDQAQAEYEQSPFNAALVLARCIEALTAAKGLERLQSADVLAVLEKYGWHRLVLQSLATYANKTE